MLNARLVIGFVLLLFVVSLAVSLVMFWVPPSDSRLAIDSYSGRSVGNRGLYELLEELRVPVSRSDSTPPALFRRRTRVLMLQPDLLRVETEKAYLEQLSRWVRDGGQLVVVTDTLDKLANRSASDGRRCGVDELIGEDRFWDRLGLAGLTVVRDPGEESEADEGEAGEEAVADACEDGESPRCKPEGEEQGFAVDERPGDSAEPQAGAGSDEETEPEAEADDAASASAAGANLPDRKRRQYRFDQTMRIFRRHLDSFQFPETEYRTRASGTLSELAGKARSLYLPVTPSLLGGEPLSRARGSFEIELDDGSWQPIALELRHGGGTVTVASELSLFSNVGLGEADNAVLAYHLAAGSGDRQVVVDEYYHGLVSRGSWIRLLAYPTYAIIAVCILMASLLWAWRYGVRFGPPAPEPASSRRSITEYIDAMARLFQRGRKHLFALHTCREGLLGELIDEMHFTRGTPESNVLTRLEQLDAERAGRVRRVLQAVDQRLADRRAVSPSALVQLQEKMDSCRNTKDRNLPPTGL